MAFQSLTIANTRLTNDAGTNEDRLAWQGSAQESRVAASVGYD